MGVASELTAKAPPAIVPALNAEIAKVLQSDEAKAQLLREGFEAAGSSPAQFAAHFRSEGVKWAAVIKAANIKEE